MTAPTDDDYHWPTLRSKLWPITVINLGGWCWPQMHTMRNWYHGCFWSFSVGPFLILGGACHIKEPPVGIQEIPR